MRKNPKYRVTINDVLAVLVEHGSKTDIEIQNCIMARRDIDEDKRYLIEAVNQRGRLVLAGMAEFTGEMRVNPSGHTAKVWRYTPKGYTHWVNHGSDYRDHGYPEKSVVWKKYYTYAGRKEHGKGNDDAVRKTQR